MDSYHSQDLAYLGLHNYLTEHAASRPNLLLYLSSEVVLRTYSSNSFVLASPDLEPLPHNLLVASSNAWKTTAPENAQSVHGYWPQP
jgi:hypothetical protein